MFHSCQSRVLVIGFIALATPTVWAGPDFVEPLSSDAGSVPSTAMFVTGPAPTRSISGRLATPTDSPGSSDFEDMFVIYINIPTIFKMKTVAISDTTDACENPYLPHSGTNFNTQLFLFGSDGRGLLANDDYGPPNPLGLSAMGNTSNDGPPTTMITVPGLYYIAISGGPNRDPISPGGLIFQGSLTEVSHADGPGGAQPITGWTGQGITNVQYEIVLCGVNPVPGIPTLTQWGALTMIVLMAFAGLAMIHRRRAAAMVATTPSNATALRQ